MGNYKIRVEIPHANPPANHFAPQCLYHVEPSRKVDIDYMGILVKDVAVTSIFIDVELRINTVLKVEAIRRNQLLPHRG